MLGRDPPHRAARDHDVIARHQAQMTVIAEELAGTRMDEQQVIAVRIAYQMIHRRAEVPVANAHVRVVQNVGGLPRRSLIARNAIQIERMRPQWPFERNPTRRRMLVMKERRRPEEALLADLALIRPRRQIRMRLARGGTFDARQREAGFHSALACGQLANWPTGHWPAMRTGHAPPREISPIKSRIASSTFPSSSSPLLRPDVQLPSWPVGRRAAPSNHSSPHLIQLDRLEQRF